MVKIESPKHIDTIASFINFSISESISPIFNTTILPLDPSSTSKSNICSLQAIHIPHFSSIICQPLFSTHYIVPYYHRNMSHIHISNFIRICFRNSSSH